MWFQLAYLLCWQFLRVAANIEDIEAFLGGFSSEGLNQPNVDSYKQCDDESGQGGRCVKASMCNPYLFLRQEKDSPCSAFHICCPEDEIITPITAKKPTHHGCGYSNPGVNSLRELSNGYAAFGEFPWMISLMRKEDSSKERFKDEYIGGGSLIDPSVVITVAHKVDEIEANELKCRAGEWNTGTEAELYKHQDRDVQKIIIHQNYLRIPMQNDVALIILKEPFDVATAPHIGAACLELEMPPPGTLCYSMGWGKDFINGDQNAVQLKKVQLPLVATSRCENMLRNTRLGSHHTLHRSLMCAGGEDGEDTCDNDGGSPLVCPIPDKLGLRYSVVGMVVYGLECGTVNVPGVYVKIPEVYDWVLKEMTTQGYTKRAFIY